MGNASRDDEIFTFPVDKAIKECYFTIPVSYNKWYYHFYSHQGRLIF